MSERFRIIDEIVKSRGYKAAFFTTFNFEIEYFERAILNRLYDNGIRKISLFIDANEFTQALNNLGERTTGLNLGKKYIVSPVAINGSFHPKMVLLLGEKKAKLIVASANIKTSGYERNNEVFNVIEYNEKDVKYQNIIVKAIDYFNHIDSISYRLDTSLISESKEFNYYRKAKICDDRFLIVNMEKSILESVRDIIKGDVSEIKIAVPYFDSSTNALKELQKVYPGARIKLYIQQGTSTFPDDFANNYNISIFDGFSDSSSGGRNFYHGKVFLFRTNNKDYILYGSANCTKSALINTHLHNGNIECDLLDVGEKNEFDDFFEKIHVIEGQNLISKTIKYSPRLEKGISFKSAEINKEGVECYFLINTKFDLIELKYQNVVLDYRIDGEKLIAFIPKEVAESMPMIFDLIAIIDDVENSIRCWIIDRYSVGLNRKETTNKDLLEDFELNSEGEKYREDRYNLLKAELMCLEELQENRKIKAILNQQQVLDEEDEESGSEDDFIVEGEMYYEYKTYLRRYDSVNRIRGIFLQQFLYPNMIKLDEFSYDKEDEYVVGSSANSLNTSRRATSEEKKFERFVKKRIKGLLDPEFVNLVSIDHYIGIIRVIFDIFKKYNNQEKVRDIFETEYVVVTKIDLMARLISKYTEIDDLGELYEKRIVIWSICILLENRYLISSKYTGIDDYKLKSFNRDFLIELESKYSIRDRLSRFIKEGEDKRNNIDYKIIQFYGVENAVSFIEDMYGYKDDSRLHKYIKDRYGNDSIIRIEKNNLIIEVTFGNIVEALRPDVDVVREVASYNRNDKKGLKGVVFIITNGDYTKNKHIASIKHTVSFDYHRCSSIISYTSGKKEITPSSFLSY